MQMLKESYKYQISSIKEKEQVRHRIAPAQNIMKRASLTVVGSGIKYKSHLTLEAKAYIEQSDRVLYLVNEPVMQEWIASANPNTQSLNDLYQRHKLRADSYRAISEYILEELQKKQYVCVVLYGHPCVFAQPALDAARKADELGYDTLILPAISALACLFADLRINPGVIGCHSYEATDLLIHKRHIEVTSHFVLWQIGFIGCVKHPKDFDNRHGLKVLQEYLQNYYPAEHPLTIYEAAQYPSFEPKVETCMLGDLQNAATTRLSTLYIPPKCQARYDNAMLEKLNLRVEDLYERKL